MSSEKTGLPLEGVRVIEFTHMVMGPTCGMILADLGAEVIKVEPPGGDKTRNLPGLGIGFFRSFNRNKKSVVIDIQTQEGLAAAKELIGQSDVLLENFRPGLMDKLGLGSEALRALFPRLIYVSHKGFLPGPYESRLALDEVYDRTGWSPIACWQFGERHHGWHVWSNWCPGCVARKRPFRWNWSRSRNPKRLV
jgi:formyl-CoA transferase